MLMSAVPLTGYLVFNESFTASKITGILLVLISIVMMNMIKSEKGRV